jgi:hypothetical protein
MREFAVRNNVRLTMPLGANLVSSASDTTFAAPESMTGFSFMSSHFTRQTRD